MNTNMGYPFRPQGRPGNSSLHSFARDESGSMSIFAMFMLLIIFLLAGAGVDIMRYERERVTLQYTLDRAVLAAADLDQPVCPREVVTNYLEKEGLADTLTSVSVEPDNCGEENVSPLGFRRVQATANVGMNTLFMHMTGVDELQAAAASTAEESIGEVEISLVLDVSGSMGNYSRLSNLKVAAKDFVDQMVSNTRDGDLSISIVPYAMQVSMPAMITERFALEGQNDWANCINFADEDYETTELNPADERPRTLHLNPWNSSDYDNRPSDYRVGSEVCDDRSSREAMIFQKDAQVLKDYIQGFQSGGNTSIDIGMKWGTALLDNSLAPIIGDLSEAGEIPAAFGDRPSTYSSGDTLKVIVLMTDGQNTSQAEILPPYRDGLSNIWWNEEERVYSTFDPDRGEYYWHGENRWEDHAYGNGTYTETTTSGRWVCNWRYRSGYCGDWDYVYETTTTTHDEPGTAVELTFPSLWEQTTVRYVRDLQAQWMGSYAADDWKDDVMRWNGTSTKDDRARDICDAAKARNVIIYTIAFEAPSSGENLLRHCASSPSHFYDVYGQEIRDAFASIGSSIRKLRLTQ